MYNRLKVKPEHTEAFLGVVQRNELISPYEIAKRSNLSLTAVMGVINELEKEEKIEVIRQDKTPKLQVRLP